MCSGSNTFNKRKPLFLIGDRVYFFNVLDVKFGEITKVDNRSLMTNKVMYLVKTKSKEYWREEKYLTQSIKQITESIEKIKRL